jgi:hypothetical protein
MARPRFALTEENRRQVKMLAAMGNPQDSIAKVIGIAPKTLRKHFDQELFRGVIEANTQVAKTVFQTATGGNVQACIFWLKTRAGWREYGPESQRTVAIPDFSVHGPASKPDCARELEKRDELDELDELDKAA